MPHMFPADHPQPLFVAEVSVVIVVVRVREAVAH
jgi:hypothetical protein